MSVEHFFGTTLRGRIPYTWLRNAKLFKLTIKSVMLGPEANDGEINIVSAATSTDTKTIRAPIAILEAGGPNVQVRLNTIFFYTVTLFLSQGKEPVHLVGNEIIGGLDDSIEEEIEKQEEVEDEEEEKEEEEEEGDFEEDVQHESELVRRG